MIIKEEITNYKCDECGEIFNNEYRPDIEIYLGRNNDVSVKARSAVEKSSSYCYGYEQSTICDKCKIKFMQYAISELKRKNGNGI